MSRGSKIALCIIVPFLYILVMTFVTVIFFARAGALTEPDIFFNVIDVLMVFLYLSQAQFFRSYKAFLQACICFYAFQA